jgi:hypothetical protein
MTAKQDKSKTVAPGFVASLFVIFIFLTGCSLPFQKQGTAQPPVSRPITADCQKATEPTEQDVTYVLNFMGDILQTDEWKRSYSVESMRIRVTWVNDSAGALAYDEYLIYPCGYTQKDVDEYFSDQNFKTIFLRDYQNPEQLAVCTDEEKNIKLREFRAEKYNQGYLLRFWVMPVNNTRFQEMMLVFPEKSAALLDQYAQEMFPTLSSCSK